MPPTIKLFEGDCIEAMDRLIDDGILFDAIITDPPYGVTDCEWDSPIPFDAMWERIKALRKPSTPIVLFGSEPFSSALRMSNISDYKYDWVWDKVLKSGHLNAKVRPMSQHETISVFGSGRITYNPIMEAGQRPHSTGTRSSKESAVYGNEGIDYDPSDSDQNYPTTMSLLKVRRPHPSIAKHPSEKPLALMEYLIKTYTSQGDTVLDFTMGSGSTGVACISLGRNFYGIEKESRFMSVAREKMRFVQKKLWL